MRKPKQSRVPRGVTVADMCGALESIVPLKLAQDWDNVGLLAGDRDANVRHVMLAIDLTEPVVREAMDASIDFIVSYHPPIFKPIRSLVRPGTGMEALAYQCIREGVAIYTPHTALDAADGGTNDCLARLCGIDACEALVTVDDASRNECKIVVFVPHNAVEIVADAMFQAGAGHIGEYSQCSFRTSGEGTFFGNETTNPNVGSSEHFERVEEVRLETILRSRDIPAVIAAMRSAHPYEEPAFDIYPLRSRPIRGIGRVGRLEKPLSLRDLTRKLKRATNAKNMQFIGSPDKVVDRAVIVVGSAGSLPFQIPLTPRDVIVTGEIRHHNALQIQRHGCAAIALGHWASERPVLHSLRDAIAKSVQGIRVDVSAADRDPFDSL
ncbi:MAG: Nif3-like dinuclear metal center hexameric protein [Planctomycetes bacterium]|nr:Nif3-like dinuclear metal center hexameric protein [Planctomycetota bacterium]